MYFQYNRYVFVKKKNIKRRGFNFVETDYVRLLNNCNTELEYLLFVKKKCSYTTYFIIYVCVYVSTYATVHSFSSNYALFFLVANVMY